MDLTNMRSRVARRLGHARTVISGAKEALKAGPDASGRDVSPSRVEQSPKHPAAVSPSVGETVYTPSEGTVFMGVSLFSGNWGAV